jgi:hypothetical protein
MNPILKRIKEFDWLDYVATILPIIGLVVGFYCQTLRHP